MALELLRRTLTDSVAFAFANREKTGPADWARQAIRPPDSPAEAQRGQDLYSPATPKPTSPSKPFPLATEPPPIPPTFNLKPLEVGKPELPPIPLASPPKDTFQLEKPSLTSGFGLGDGKDTSPVSAFDKPQSVVIVGPNPLPVKMDLAGAFKMPQATTPRGEREPNSGGALSIGKAIATRFIAVLGPLYALSTVLQQTNSGVGVFGKAVNVIGATLAPLLLPVFALLAAGLLSMSDIIWSKLLPALGDFYKWVLKVGVPAVESQLADAEDKIDTVTAIKNFITKGEAPKAADVPRMAFASVPGANQLADIGKWIGKQVGVDVPELPRGSATFRKPGDGGENKDGTPQTNPDGTPKKTFGSLMSENFDKVIKSLAMSMGPKAAYSGIAEAGKQAQLAALNQDPIEAQQLRIMQQSLEELQKVVGALNKDDPKDQINRREERR